MYVFEVLCQKWVRKKTNKQKNKKKWVRIYAYQFLKVADLKFRNIKIRKSWNFY